jgi:protein subunit release factor B
MRQCGRSACLPQSDLINSVASAIHLIANPAVAMVSCTRMIMIVLPESDDDLLRECEVETFRSSGPGGQHVNKTESAVRLRHLPSGVVVTSQQERSQYRNKAICLVKLREKVGQLNYRAPKRVPTRIPRSAKKRTLEEKSRRAQIKRLRSKPSSDE